MMNPENPVISTNPEELLAAAAPADVNRRSFLRLAGLGLAASYTLLSLETAEGGVSPTDSNGVFPQSVTSGDPTSTGFVLWTRIAPTAVVAGAALTVEIASDSAFTQKVLRAKIAATQIKASLDYTVRADFNGLLQSNSIYFYRFVYNGVTSRTGRGRTLPATNASLDKVKFAVVNCQDYTNGYYPSYGYIANDPSIDFVVHVGDFIYETVGGTSFQPGPYTDRNIDLPLDPTGTIKTAQGIADYRKLYQTYQGDPFLRAARENFTWIIIWDDHEMANDNYHDYANNSQGAPDHPFNADADKVNKLRQLKFESQQAWFEYTPSRVGLNLNATDIFGRLSIYRKFKFGNLVELFMTDERTYRSAHPFGEGQFIQRYISRLVPSVQGAADRTMLGTTQRNWFVNSVSTSTALWKVWGNEVQLSPFTLYLDDQLAAAVNAFLGIPANAPFAYTAGLHTFDNDAWDGYQYERAVICGTLKQAGVKNLVVLTGDFHSYYASLVKVDFSNGSNADANLLGVEYMTPAITSSNLADQLNNGAFTAILSGMAVNPSLNPHGKFFDSAHYGYATVEFNASLCEFTMYVVDKSTNLPSATRTVLKKFQTPVNVAAINEVP
jgi:alkaline phosphatase D